MRDSFYDEYFRIEDRHWWFIGRRRILLETLEARLGPMPTSGRRILDLGCGTGTMLKYLRRFGEAEGVDADERAVAFCRARGEDQVQVLESHVLPFKDDSFGLVTAFDVLEHIEDDRMALSEIGRILEPGGVLLATVPAYHWLWGAQDEISHHFRRYGAAELAEKVSGGGFGLQRMTYFNSILLPAIASVRLARRLRPKPAETRSDFDMNRPGRVNDTLARVLSSEAVLLRRFDLPFGTSILALATVPGLPEAEVTSANL